MSLPTIVPQAVSRTLCDTAAFELKDTTAIKEQNSEAELELSATCAEIAREAHKAHGARVSSVGGGSVQPCSLSVVNFREPLQAAPSRSENPKNVYFAIALTTLNAATGILNFYPKDGSQEGSEQVAELKPGDGIICRGEDGNPRGGGQGGIVLMIRYQRKVVQD